MAEETISISLKRLQKFEGRLSHLENEMVGVKAGLNDLIAGQGQILAILGSHQQFFAKINNRLDSIDSRLKRMENRLELGDTDAS